MSVATARIFVLRVLVASVVVAACAASWTTRAVAQGITTSAVRGSVMDEAGQPVVGATIILTGRFTGQRYQGVTQGGGLFYLTNIPVGPYSVEARAIGYRPARTDGLTLSLGQVTETHLRMQASTIELTAITTSATQTGLEPMSVDRTGAASLVTDSSVRRLPSLTRNFTDFIATVPQVVGTSVAGNNNRYNNIQIDGSVNNDLFGLAASGTPGGQADAKPISVEAIREFQVLIAPFDIRQGGFTGGLVNAVTQSGTNRWRGSIFGFRQSDEFVGKDSAGGKVANFSQTQYGFSLSGPIMRDRLHFFSAVDLQSKDTPFAGQLITSDTTGGKDSIGVGIRRPTAERVEQYAINTLGFNPGSFLAPPIQTPSANIFAKLSWQPSLNNTFEFSYNHVDGSDGKLTRNSTATGNRDGYQLSGSGYKQANTTNTFRAIWTRPFGSRLNNEMIVAYQTIRDHRELANQVPLILVGGDRGQGVPGAPTVPTTNIAIGGERFSHGNSLDQNIFEFTDNVTWNINTVHTVTFGTHNELFSFNNVFFPAKYGIWNFSNADSLQAGRPYRYEIALPGANGIGPIADFGVRQFGFYAQDQITPNRRLTLTMGLRVDLPNLDRPNYNPNLDTASAATIVNGPRAGQKLGINTQANFPASNPLWSPRFGFNYDVNGNGSLLLRGGIGIFSGRPPYVWVSNAFVNTGLEQVTLICDANVSTSGGLLDSVPTFTTNVNNLPTNCGGTVAAGASAASIVYYDQNFKLPQTARLALGMDHRLPWSMVGTVDFIYSRWLNSFYLTDVNLIPGGRSVGEAGRQLYGTISGTSSTNTPRRLTSSLSTQPIQFRDIIRQSNSDRDYSYQLTFQLQKRFSDGVEFNAGYTYARSYDVMSLTSSISNSNLRFTSLDGTLENRNLRPSVFDVPHVVKFSVTGNLPWKFSGTLFYVGRSGTPYAYTYSNDANADGLSGNDLVYVPANAQDIQLCPLSGACSTASQDPAAYARLDQYIQNEPCLRDHRGSILPRNSCRNPWQSFVNARLAKTIPTIRGQHVEITADMFNLLSFLGIGGKVKETSTFEEASLLSLNRYNSALGRGVYSLALPTYQRVNSTASRWRLLLGARYAF